MKFIIKFIISILFLSILTQYSYGENKNPIKKISYEGYLSGSTIININGNLKDCNLVSVAGKKINYEKSDNKINFYFREINNYNGIIILNCNGNKYRKDFFFPHIIDYKIFRENNKNNIIQVKGENFLKNSNIHLGGNNLNIKQQNNYLIIADIKSNLKNTELFITNGNLKSNLLNVDIPIPKINYIKSNNGFKAGTILNIFTKNFEFSENNIIVINDKDRYQVLAKNYNKNYVSFKLPEKYLGENKIYLLKQGIKSNEINFKIYPKSIPIIKQIIPGIDKDGNKILKIRGENFINSKILKVKIGKNGINAKIKSINNNEIIIYEENKIKNGNNYIYIEEAKIYSNMYNYLVKGDKKPFIAEITTEGLTPDKKYRIFRLTTNYFNKKTDGLTLDNNSVYNYGYYGNLIKTKIDKSKTKGYFGFTRNNKKLNYIKKFNFDYNFSPVIKLLRIKGDFIPGTKIEIKGRNFLNANITSSNLFGKNADGTYDISISDTSIKGYLPKNFKIDQNSNINIENNGKIIQLSFNLKESNKKNIDGPFVLNKIVNNSNNFIIKQGDTLNIYGSYFHTTDKIYLNDNKVNSTFINPTQIKLKLDDNIKPGIYKIKIKNNIGIETKLGEYFIFNKKLNPKIKFYQQINKNKDISINPINQDTKNNIFLKYNITNKLNDFQVNKVVFKVKNYNPKLYLNLFDLKFNNQNISSATITEKGFIVFNTPFIIKKELNNQNNNILSIEKDSPYVRPGKIDLYLEKIEGVFILNNTEKDANNNIEINNIKTNFNIFFDNKEIKNCIIPNNQLISCSEINQEKKNNEKQNNEKDEIKTTDENKINQELLSEKLKHIKQLVNSRHKLNKSLKGQKYIKLIDKITIKYSKNLETLLKLDKKIKTLQEKLKNKNGLKYQETKNIINYLDAKIYLEIIKLTK